jgi:uncharacterized protein with HEPN domain
MPSKNPAQRLRDIVDSIDAIGAFTAELDRTAFTQDRKTVYAVVQALEIISEASRRLPTEIISRHPEIDWVAIAAAGNVYRHEYEAGDESLIWHTVQHDLAVLRSVAAAELAGLGS